MSAGQSTPSVSVQGLSKAYWKDGRVRADTLRDTLSFRRWKKRENPREFHALKDVSFELQRGETLGVIGANGSGKSTLLKVLSRVIEPTKGSLRVEGRTASLLEVGTGFHPELTGRENMYFNGSLLGMTSREIERRSGAILEFAGVEDFADTPVKHYSSGMYVRLAFAVAAQLEPDVFIVDEALAVGDIQFQQRCVERMRDAARGGQTVILVTHSMGFIDTLCDTGMLLDHGQVKQYGAAPDVVSAYLDSSPMNRATAEWNRPVNEEVPDWNPVIPQRMRILNEAGSPTTRVKRGSTTYVELEFELTEDTLDVSVGFTLLSEHNVRLLRSTPFDFGTFTGIRKGRHVWKARLPTEALSDGTFTVSFDADRYASAWYQNPFNTNAKVSFEIEGGTDQDQIVHWHKDREGSLKLPISWNGNKGPKPMTAKVAVEGIR
jgi:lipopolysaccharide transport system ATP-binding protein